MEQLHKMLVDYNRTIPTAMRTSWSKQYLASEFPLYWKIVYSTLKEYDRAAHVVEVGAGQGDVTSILCYLGFSSIKSYERTPDNAEIAKQKIADLFRRNDVIKPVNFPTGDVSCDILIMVNCAYADGCTTKDEYLKKLRFFWETAGRPKHTIMEVIDSSYEIDDDDFPKCIRLCPEDISSLFPESNINSFETYRYPNNKRSKRLYIIDNSL